MIINLDKEIKGWYNEGESINKMMLGGWRIFQKFSPDTDPKGEYRWVVVPDEYLCSGTTKMEKLKKQVTYDGGNWQDVVPPIYKAGDVIEYDSEDCGYIPPQYRWININPLLEYVCVGVDKHYKQQKQVSWDGGISWENVEPSEYRTGDLYQADSEDCGYIPPQYRDVSGTPYCVNFDKMVDVEHQVSFDGGGSWSTTATTTTMIEHNSEDCGYVPQGIYRWTIVPNEYLCGKGQAIKYQKKVKEVSYDEGETWQRVIPEETLNGGVLELYSTDCGWSGNTIGRIYLASGWDSNGYSMDITPTSTMVRYTNMSSYYLYKNLFEFELSGDTLTNLCGIAGCPANGRGGTVIRKMLGISTPLSTKHIADNCFNGIWATTNTNNKFSIVLNEGLETIGRNGLLGLADRIGAIDNIIVIPSTVTSIGNNAFGWSSNTDADRGWMINYYFKPTTPPFNSSNKLWATFEPQRHIRLYVPIGCGEAYRNALNPLYSGITITETSNLTNISSRATNYGLLNIRKDKWNATYTNGMTWVGACAGTTNYLDNNDIDKLYDKQPSRTNLVSITVGDCVTILAQPFESCTHLTTVDLPSTITSIQTNAFDGCTALQSLTIHAVTPPTLSAWAFGNTGNFTIYVPSESVEAYKSANVWSNYASRIQAIP